MKVLFAAIACLLILCSIALYASFPDVRTEVPVIYWVTDPNPARGEQIRLFHEWLIEGGEGEQVVLTSEQEVRAFHERLFADPLKVAMRDANDGGRLLWDEQLTPLVPTADQLPVTVTVPRMELRLDTGNRDQTKKVIQSVSGVASDTMDMGGTNVPYFVEMGVLMDLTEAGLEMGFDPSKTWQAIVPDITVEGRQYAFPCNVYSQMYWVNKETFRNAGMDVPPRRWTFEQFEAMGREFSERLNRKGDRRQYFLANDVALNTIHRSMGLSVLNETGTRCIVDDPRFAEALRLKKKWMNEDHLIPSAVEQAGFETQSGYAGPVLQLFNSGNYGMFSMGRYALIQLRKFDKPLQLSVSEPPHGDMPVTATGTRCATIYIDGQTDLAKYFLAYLASEKYNAQIVADADALPPNPAFADSEAFRRPADYPNEWGVHEAFSQAAREIAVPATQSRFILSNVVTRRVREAEESFISGLATAEEAGLNAARLLNDEIERQVKEDPSLAEPYQQRLETQKKIEQYRAEGRKVPLEWIDNVFYRRYYQFKGWAE